ncbi:MAG: AAA family ATPase, partial [Clostridia bacterium]|nr:AAA family ATPase [Clostridia bacterium]
MKLLKLYIENFGKISKTEYDFNSDLTAFCYENGYGKTTLATFIKVMFYGLPKVTKNTKFNDREHYYPFDGGKFGGNITFEKDGKIYKIVRFFDKTSETKDEITLYENDNLVNAIPENIGKWVFGVDEASYSRTLYFSEASSINETSSDITFKLTGVVDSSDDESFIGAKKMLEEAKKNLK